MEDIDYTIKRLQDQQNKVDLGDTQVWLDTTYSFIEEYFKSYSEKAVAFRSLVADFRATKADKDAFKKRGLEYIAECLHNLKEQKEQQTGVKLNRTPETTVHKAKTVANLVDTDSPTPFIEGKEAQAPVSSLPFGLSVGLFWTVFAAVLIASFFLGYFLG